MALPPLMELELRALGVLEKPKPKALPQPKPVKPETFDETTGEYTF